MIVGASAAGAAYVKTYLTPGAARTALARSIVARKAGVPTPAVLGWAGPRALSFEGVASRDRPGLDQMVAVQSMLRGMPRRDLVRFDPFLRIRPRLGRAPEPVTGLAKVLMAQDAGLRWDEATVVHGDFHPGQVLCDAAGKVWLVDLDDMALGPPEADLGNLAAWLATQAPGDLADLASGARLRVLAACPRADPVLLAHFCAIAVLRRALKLAEKGSSWAVAQLGLRP